MIKALITDLSRVILFPKDKSYTGSLNSLHRDLSTHLNYRLLDNFELNSELLNYYKSLGNKLDLYLFTSEIIQDSPELQPFIKPNFKAVYSALSMGVGKKDEDAYLQLSSKIDIEPDEIVYIDDNEINLNAAKKAGLQTILYKDNDTLKTELQAKLKE
jgi:FMN phosphatase YigB (HAD superfamily)